MQLTQDPEKVLQAISAAAQELWVARGGKPEESVRLRMALNDPNASACWQEATAAVSAAFGVIFDTPTEQMSTVTLNASTSTPGGSPVPVTVTISYPDNLGALALDTMQVLQTSRSAVEAAMRLGGDVSVSDQLVHIDMPENVQ